MSLNVTVVIPAYNAQKTIAQAIASALNQSLRPYEILVIDDGSSDETAEYARAAGATVLDQANAGVSIARNRGIAAAKAEWIAFLDADDMWAPNRLAQQAQALVYCPNASFVFCDMRREQAGKTVNSAWMTGRSVYQQTPRERITEAIARFQGHDLARALLHENFISTSSVLIRRDAIPTSGFKPEIRYCEDLEMWLRILANHHALAVEKPLVTYCLHEASTSAQWAKILRGDIALCQRIIRQPQGYTSGLDQSAHMLLQPRMLSLAQHLIRVSSYTEARDVLAKLPWRKFSVRTLLLYAISGLFMLPGAQQFHRKLRGLRARYWASR